MGTILFWFLLCLSCVLVIKINGTDFTPAYHIIHTVACTTYQWNVTASGVVSVTSKQGSVCSKNAFGTRVGPTYSGMANCTVNSTSGSIGVKVTFCFYNMTSAESGVYQLITGGQLRNGTVFVMDKPTTPRISPTTVEAGRRETLNCTSTSTSTPSPTGQAIIYTWTVNDAALSDQRFSTSGRTLTINTARKEDKDNLFQCTARESQGLSSNTTGIRLTVRYPPEGAPRFINPILIHNESNTVSFTCSLPSNGNPPVSWIWTIGTRNFSSGYIINTGNQSTLRFQISRAENVKLCRCRAVSLLFSYDSFSEILIEVSYPSRIKSLSVSSQNIMENDSISIVCEADGNPDPTIQWINDDDKTTIKTDSNYGSASILRFNRINCLDTATYKVFVFNGYGYSESRFINISVSCKPRTVIDHILTNIAPVGTDKKLNITFDFISNPMPNINWFFRLDKSEDNTTLDKSSFTKNTKSIGKVIYRTTLTGNLTCVEYGIYIAQLKNDLGYIKVEFKAVSIGPPDTPTELFFDCSLSNKATIHWTPGFNGIGEDGRQIFTIQYKRMNEDYFIEDSQKFNDKNGSRIAGTVDGIASGTWIFSVRANNSLGLIRASSTIACSIHDENVQENKSTLHGESVAVGMGIMLVIALVPVAVIFIIKRRQQTEGKKNDLRMYDDLKPSVPNEPNYSQIQIQKDEATEYANTAFGGNKEEAEI